MIAVEDYPLLLECWRSGQISDADMIERMRGDGLFSVWILEHVRITI
jgi:hypothetical protein